LSFSNGAAKQLKIHRNTLSARLHRIERLLDCDLDDLETQTELHLALRILDLRGIDASDDAATLDELITTDPVPDWAAAQLHPLLHQDSPLLLETLRCWLENNASLGPTSVALGISVPGVRKRLVRVEEIIERSLLAAPSARYDLTLALRAHPRFR
jgi:DNA-binding PucR family transcriptional regulator